MNIRYITSDLELNSKENISSIVDEFGDKVLIHLNERIDNIHQVALGSILDHQNPEETANNFCTLIEGLSEQSRQLWKTCNRRVLDIAFESGTKPESISYQLPIKLINKISKLGISIVITIYSVGTYSSEISKKKT